MLIAHAYPPAAASGAQRAGHVARVLEASGAEVTVVALREAGREASLVRGAQEVVEVSALPSGGDLLSAVGRFKANLRRLRRPARHGEEPAQRVADPDPMDPGPPLRRWVTALMRFPDGQLGFVPPAVHAAVARAGPADVLYTTGPPMTTHLAGLCVHAVTGLPWVAEYRDPWILDAAPYRAPTLRTRPTDALEVALEARCQAAAAEIVAVSEGIADTLAPRRAAAGRPSPHVVLNGIPELFPTRSIGSRSGPLRLLHLGNLYAFRDPRPFFDALAAVRTQRAWGPDQLQVEFVGDPPPSDVRAHVEANRLDDVVRFVSWVPHETGQALIRDTDILLLLAQRQPLQVPNKLYEYLGSRNPILAFADAQGETARMLQQAGRHRLVTEHDGHAHTRIALTELLDWARDQRADPDPTPSGADDRLEAWTTERQLAALPGILDRACGDRRRVGPASAGATPGSTRRAP